MGKISELFVKFWCNNIKTNYKKISMGIGTALNMIIGAVIMYFMSSVPMTNLGIMLATILLALWGLSNLFVFSFFGKTKNGNGYGMPETKAIVDLIKNDPEFRTIAKRKLIAYIMEGDSVFNHDEDIE